MKTKPSKKLFALALLAVSLTCSVVAQEVATPEPAPTSTLAMTLTKEPPITLSVTNFVTLTNTVCLTNKVDVTNTVPRQAIIQGEDLPAVVIEVRTNTVTQWVPIERLNEGTREVGYVITNRVVELTHNGATKEVAVLMLGREEWPSQHRTNSVAR